MPIPDSEDRIRQKTFFNIAPLPLGEVLPVVSTINDLTGVKAEGMNRRIDLVLARRRSPIMRSLTRIVANPAEEAERAFTLLKEDVDQFHFDKDMLGSDQFPQWFFRIRLGGVVTSLVARSEVLRKPAPSSQTEYLAAVGQQRANFISTMHGLTSDDLQTFISGASVMSGGDRGFELSSADLKPHPILGDELMTAQLGKIESSKRLAANAGDIAHEIYFKGVMESYAHGWDRVRGGWGWDQVSSATRLLQRPLPTIVKANLAAAIEDALRGPNFLTIADNAEGAKKIGPQDLKTLLGIDWEKIYLGFNGSDYPHLTAGWEEMIWSDLPYHNHMPTIVMAMVDRLAQSLPKENLYETLSSTQGLVEKDSSVVKPWVLALHYLRTNDTYDSGLITDMIGQLKGCPGRVRQILLDQEPGTFYLDNKGNIAYKEGPSPFVTWEVYTSKAVDKPSKDSKDEAKPGKKGERQLKKDQGDKVRIRIATKMRLPLIGEVGIPVGSKTKRVLDSTIAAEALALQADGLFEQAVGLRKVEILPDKRVYIAALNESDQIAKLMRRVGLSAVYKDRNYYTFVLDNSRLAGRGSGNQEIPVALFGSIDEQRELSIRGLSDEFAFDSRGLAYNVIAVLIAVEDIRDTRVISTAVQDVSIDVKKEADAYLRKYNRESAVRLSTNVKNRTVMLKLPSGNTILVGEESKK